MLRVSTLLAFCLAIFSAASAQVVRPFAVRYTTSTRGKLVLVSNSILSSKGSGVNTAGVAPGCGSGSCKNDNLPGTNIDIDGDAATHNSSSATLALPSCGDGVAFAGLYWGAGIAKGQGSNGSAPLTVPAWGTVKLKTPSTSSYTNVVASTLDSVHNIYQGYQAFADVTALVQAGGTGTYTVANVACDTDKINTYGGWTMVVVYHDPAQPLRNLTVFDGLAVLSTDADAVPSADINLAGFHAPATGAVGCQMGLVAYDGDRGAVDGFRVKRNADSTYVDQTAAGEGAAFTSGSGDVLNSTITTEGIRTPSFNNTFGYDADLFALSNATQSYIRNGDSTLGLRISTSNEGYVLGVVTTQVDNQAPELVLGKTLIDINGGTTQPGDTILVKATLRNIGNDTAVAVRVADVLPAYFSYVPGSMRVAAAVITDAAADDAGEYITSNRTLTLRPAAGGILLAGAVADSMSYRLIISSNCAVLGTGTVKLAHQSYAYFRGDGAEISTGSRPVLAGGCPAAPQADTLTVLIACGSVALGLDVVRFDATATSAGVQLEWTVREQSDVTAYLPQVSTDGRNFQTMEMLPVAGFNGLRTMSAVDGEMRAASTIYYRVAVRDLAGNQHYTRTLAIASKNLNQAGEVALAPNPGNTLRVNGLVSGTQVSVYDLGGRCVVTAVDASVAAVNVPVEALPAGLYFIRISGAQVATLRWMKQ